VVVLIAPLGAYLGGYLWLGERFDLTPSAFMKCYPYRWQEALFRPAAAMESWIRGIDVFGGLPPDD
jgi:hypothetical protein